MQIVVVLAYLPTEANIDLHVVHQSTELSTGGSVKVRVCG